MYFNPTDKVNDLLKRFEKYSPVARRRGDEGYDWLSDDADVCVEIKNPDPKAYVSNMIIHCEDDCEFTLYYCGHAHYSPNKEEYEMMCRMAFDILSSEIGAVTVFEGEERSWQCFSFERREDIERSIWEYACELTDEEIDSLHIYDFEKDIMKRMKTVGGEVEYRLWDSSLCKTIKIEKAEAGI